jgi:hypothetical protein
MATTFKKVTNNAEGALLSTMAIGATSLTLLSGRRKRDREGRS